MLGKISSLLWKEWVNLSYLCNHWNLIWNSGDFFWWPMLNVFLSSSQFLGKTCKILLDVTWNTMNVSYFYKKGINSWFTNNIKKSKKRKAFSIPGKTVKYLRFRELQDQLFHHFLRFFRLNFQDEATFSNGTVLVLTQ